MKTRILLVRPKAANLFGYLNLIDAEPLELEYLQTVLSNEDVEIYDGIIEKRPFERVMKKFKPDILAVTGYITQENLVKDYCRIAKKYNPHIITIIGGTYAQLNYKRFYNENIDFIFRSASVNDFAFLVNAIKKNDISQLNTINGLCYKIENKFYKNKLKPVDINELPIPKRDFFYKNKKYYRYLDLEEVATIKASFSCPYNCSFCYCTKLNCGQYSVRALELIIDEIKSIKTKNIQIVDDDFLVDKKRVSEFIKLIKENNIEKNFVCYARSDFVANNPKLIKELKEIGFKYFLIGFEAVTDKYLAEYSKSNNTDNNDKAISVLKKYNAEPIALLVIPIDADKKYFDQVYRWVVKNRMSYVTASIFTPIPGTDIFNKYRKSINCKRIENWDFLHLVMKPEKLSVFSFYFYFFMLNAKIFLYGKKQDAYRFMDYKFYFNLTKNLIKLILKV